MLHRIVFVATFAAIVKCITFMDKSGQDIETDQNDPRIAWDLVPKSDTQWNGILAHGCSSALIQTWPDGSNPDPALPAYLLTAGHCLAPFNTDQHRGKVYMDSTEFPRVFIGGYTFDSVESERKNYPMRTIRFATMNLTDLAVVEMQATAQELLNEGLNFYKLSKREMSEGATVEMVGYPGVGDGFRRHSRGTALRRQPTDESWGHYMSMTWEIRVRYSLFFSLILLTMSR